MLYSVVVVSFFFSCLSFHFFQLQITTSGWNIKSPEVESYDGKELVLLILKKSFKKMKLSEDFEVNCFKDVSLESQISWYNPAWFGRDLYICKTFVFSFWFCYDGWGELRVVNKIWSWRRYPEDRRHLLFSLFLFRKAYL